MNPNLSPARANRPVLPALVVSVVLLAAAGTWLVGRSASTDATTQPAPGSSPELAAVTEENTAPALGVLATGAMLPAETNSAPAEPATTAESATTTARAGNTNEEPHAALAALMQLPEGAERTAALLQLVAAWSTNAPAAAALALCGLPAGPDRDAGLGQVVAVWSNTDPAAALRWLQEAGENADSTSLLRSIAYQAWTAQDPAAAGRHALANGADASSIQAILAGWTATQPDAAWDFYQQLPDATRRAASGSFLLSVAATDPVRAMDLMTRHLNDSNQPDQWLALGRSLAQLDLDLALTFEQLLPPGSAQDRLRTELDARLLSEFPDDDLGTDSEDDSDDSDDSDVAVRRPLVPGPTTTTTGAPQATLHSANPGKSSTR